MTRVGSIPHRVIWGCYFVKPLQCLAQGSGSLMKDPPFWSGLPASVTLRFVELRHPRYTLQIP